MQALRVLSHSVVKRTLRNPHSKPMTERSCTNCGKPVESLPYELWLFHTCQSCAQEETTRRWPDGYGTERKWAYAPRWHQTRHPGLAEQRRERFA